MSLNSQYRIISLLITRQIPAIAPIKGTMRVHQMLSVSPGKLKYRDITCLCKREAGMSDCPCYQLMEATISEEDNHVPAFDRTTETRWRPQFIETKHIGEWCVVNYDNEAYPGIIIEVEEHNIMVKCMHRNGINKFFWRSPREDVTWYADRQILCLIPEPQVLNKRSVQVDKASWKYVEEQLK